MDKKSIRREVKTRIAAMTVEEKRAASLGIFDEIVGAEQFRTASVVALFASLPDEPQTGGFIAEWSGRKRLVLPRVEGNVMRFYDYAPERMHEGAFGISEPEVGTECPPEDIDFIIVPAVAYTRSGDRLGRGKGFYDRYMSQPAFRAYKVGVCFGTQIVDVLPSEPFDVRVDWVVSR